MLSWPHIRPMRSLRRSAWEISITRPWRLCGSSGRGCGSPRLNLTLIDVDRRTRLVYSDGVPFMGRATSCLYCGLLLEDWKGCKTIRERYHRRSRSSTVTYQTRVLVTRGERYAPRSASATGARTNRRLRFASQPFGVSIAGSHQHEVAPQGRRTRGDQSGRPPDPWPWRRHPSAHLYTNGLRPLPDPGVVSWRWLGCWRPGD